MDNDVHINAIKLGWGENINGYYNYNIQGYTLRHPDKNNKSKIQSFYPGP